MNTTIIDKILIHMLDMEHSQIIYSDQFIDLIEGTTEYYDKKIEKLSWGGGCSGKIRMVESSIITDKYEI